MSLDSMEHIKKSTNHTFLQLIEQIFKTINNKKLKYCLILVLFGINIFIRILSYLFYIHSLNELF